MSDEVPCKEHPDAPHGFSRNASHTEGRYVCDCENWEPPIEFDVNVYLTGEDARYPTLVIQGEFGSRGYSVNNTTGELSRVCICHAYNANECCCGAWDIEVYNEGKTI